MHPLEDLCLDLEQFVFQIKEYQQNDQQAGGADRFQFDSQRKDIRVQYQSEGRPD